MEGNLRIRIKFEKTGRMQYLGHLDELRVFEQALRRTRIDVARTDGYTPRMILSFASPLGIGKTSRAEYVDVDLWSLLPSEEILARLNREFPDGYRAVSARMIPWYRAAKAMCASAYAAYEVAVPGGRDFEQELIDGYLAQERITVIKPDADNRRIREVDIKPGIYSLRPAGPASLRMLLAAGSGDSIRPELVLSSLASYAGDPDLFGEQFGDGKMRFPGVRIERSEIYAKADPSRMEQVGSFDPADVVTADDGETRMVPLWALGEKF